MSSSPAADVSTETFTSTEPFTVVQIKTYITPLGDPVDVESVVKWFGTLAEARAHAQSLREDLRDMGILGIAIVVRGEVAPAQSPNAVRRIDFS